MIRIYLCEPSPLDRDLWKSCLRASAFLDLVEVRESWRELLRIEFGEADCLLISARAVTMSEAEVEGLRDFLCSLSCFSVSYGWQSSAPDWLRFPNHCILRPHHGFQDFLGLLGVFPTRNRARQNGTSLLSAQEGKVMSLLILGKTHKEIADELGLSISSVQTYRSRLLRKLKLRNTSDLVAYATTNGLRGTGQGTLGSELSSYLHTIPNSIF